MRHVAEMLLIPLLEKRLLPHITHGVDNSPLSLEDFYTTLNGFKDSTTSVTCWVWKGYVPSLGVITPKTWKPNSQMHLRPAIGQISFAGKRRSVHRLLYACMHDLSYLDLKLKHVCKHPLCVNPNHYMHDPYAPARELRINHSRHGIANVSENRVLTPMAEEPKAPAFKLNMEKERIFIENWLEEAPTVAIAIQDIHEELQRKHTWNDKMTDDEFLDTVPITVVSTILDSCPRHFTKRVTDYVHPYFQTMLDKGLDVNPHL